MCLSQSSVIIGTERTNTYFLIYSASGVQMHLSASGLYLKLITGVSDTSLSKTVVFCSFFSERGRRWWLQQLNAP